MVSITRYQANRVATKLFGLLKYNHSLVYGIARSLDITNPDPNVYASIAHKLSALISDGPLHGSDEMIINSIIERYSNQNKSSSYKNVIFPYSLTDNHL